MSTPRGPRPPGASRCEQAAELYLRGGHTLAECAARFGVSAQGVNRRARRLRAERGIEVARAPEPTPAPGPSLAQTIDMLRLQSGQAIQPSGRRNLAARGWIVNAGKLRGSAGGIMRGWELSRAGRDALASSVHVAAARRAIDVGDRAGVWR